MSVQIKDYTGQVENQITQRGSLFLRTMADEIHRIADPKTPKDTGRLRMDILKQVLGLRGKIAWNKRYAAIQEVKLHRRYTTAGTGPHYAENAVKEGVQRTSDVARRVFI